MTEIHTPLIGTASEAGWIAPTLTNSWINYDANNYPAAAYRIDGKGFVHLRGLIKNGTITASVFTLPEGYRPPHYLHMAVASYGLYGQVRIGADGTIVAQVGDNRWFSLDGITFKANVAAPGKVHDPAIGRDGNTAWTNLAYANSWVSFNTAGAYPELRYMKDVDGIVHIEGLIMSGTINATCATLPAGYRPAYSEIYIVPSNNAFGEARISTLGVMLPRLGSNGWFSWSGISFRAEA